jgi:hypothetical protein
VIPTCRRGREIGWGVREKGREGREGGKEGERERERERGEGRREVGREDEGGRGTSDGTGRAHQWLGRPTERCARVGMEPGQDRNTVRMRIFEN